ncbi:hypothetical protein [Aquifex aeolicus]|uniref:hypothetical protein n=1 Tax=Aquifex aeolicus TaxID=63363 RepID=UPI000313B368|nr:hypothetical protein [Aquifex aeolicus]
MKKALIFLLSLSLLIPAFSEAKPKSSKKKYYTYEKYKKYKKKRRVWIRRYPRKANTLTDAHRVKLEEMVKEMF